MTKTELEAKYKDFKWTKLPQGKPRPTKKAPLYRPLYYGWKGN